VTPDNKTSPNKQLTNSSNSQTVAQNIAAELRGSSNAPASTPMAPLPLALPTVYYNKSNLIFWMETASGDYIPLGRPDLEDHLVAAGLRRKRLKHEALSQVDNEIVRIQRVNHLDFVGDLAGHRKGIVRFGSTRCLIIDEPKFIEPQPGDCPLIMGILNGMFEAGQLDYLLGWIKVALEMFQTGSWLAGQALVLCGPAGAGKNLLCTLLSRLFGGRMPGKPYQYMTGRTTFNAELIGAELLAIEDEAEGKSIKERRHFGMSIKDMTVNANQRLHDKGKRALQVVVLRRLLISLNDEPEALLVLPPIDPGIEDKLMLFKVSKKDMPMPTTTAAEQKTFLDALVNELPAFAYYVANWTIPPALSSPRFGIKHFQHNELLASLQELSPEIKLLELIDMYVFGDPAAPDRWSGRAVKLERYLKGSEDRRCQKEADNLLAGAHSCGVYLGRLAKIYPHRVTSRVLLGHTVWTVHQGGVDADTTESGDLPEIKPNKEALLAKVQAARLPAVP
jgi:hypothetical protein